MKRDEMFNEELRYLHMIKPEEIKIRYYNLNITNNEIWHKYPENIKTIGQKISLMKTGKNTGPRDASVGKNISLSKTESFKKRRLENENGKAFTQEHIENMRQSKLEANHKQTDEWKKAQSELLKEQWKNELIKCTKNTYLNNIDQGEYKDDNEKKTLENLIAKHSDTEAADLAKQALKRLK